MKKTRLSLILIVIVGFSFLSTTWFESTHRCPLCKTKNTFQEPGSWGSYIYQWDSKFEYIYWPLTDNPVVYACKKCRLSTFMWDFDSVHQAKMQDLRTYLKDIRFSVKTSNYLDVPITERLEVAQGVYNILGKDDDFWSRFFRVKGYHYAAAGNETKAAESREEALRIAERMKADSLNVPKLKELYLITGAMKYHLNRKAEASMDFEKALSLKYAAGKPDTAEGMNAYMDGLLQEFLSR